MIWLGLVSVVVVGFAWMKVRRNRKAVEATLGAD